MPSFMIDGHLDIAWNALTFGRDYRRDVAETRRLEAANGSIAPQVNGDTLLGWDAFQKGRLALVFATLYASPIRARSGPWSTQFYATPAQAYPIYQGQADYYARLVDESPQQFTLVRSQAELASLMQEWKEPIATPKAAHLGLVLLMEGAEAIRDPGELEEWWGRGLRILGPAWMGNRYCGGTHEPGPLTKDGMALLEAMADLGLILDVSHMDAQAALQALERYPGRIIASHANALALLKGESSNRQLPDTVIRNLVGRGGVIGIVPHSGFLLPGWKRGARRDLVRLQHVAAQIDYICQLAGSARHVGFGSDFDGGFGVQEVPEEMDTIADFHKLAPLLSEKGYSEDDVEAIFGGNWLAQLEQGLPE